MRVPVGTGALRRILTLSVVLVLFATLAGQVAGRDRPHGTSRVNAFTKLSRLANTFDNVKTGQAGSKLSKQQIERFTCESSGNPGAAVDISCNDTELGQDFAPDNEIAVAVNPFNPDHIVAGSNDYFYRFNNSTGARQAIVPTGFFMSSDGGQTWLDGQIPMLSGNGAGDPSPAFVGKLSDPTGNVEDAVVLMAQLENVAGQGGFFVSQGNVSVSRSIDGGQTWSQPVVVMKGQGAGIGPANNAKFFDKEWLTVDNNPDSDFYGRAYLTATLFENGLQGSYISSPIYLSYSDDGGLTWSTPEVISGSHTSCTYQETGPANECDEDQFSIPTVAPDGTVYVHFLNAQNEAAWEVDFDFDSQILVVKSIDGGQTFSNPTQAAQLEDGLSDMPYSVIRRQTVWGHQIRWASAGNIVVDPTDVDHVTVIWSDRGTANPNAAEGCFLTEAGGLNIGEAPTYDPCDAGPGSDLNIYRSDSLDGGDNWTGRTLVDDASGNSQWFPWGGYQSNGDLVIAWDEDTAAAPADTFVHVLWDENGGSPTRETLSTANEQVDISLTHWAGQYVPEEDWPADCGPAGYSDPPVTDAEGKDCNVFHGDYTGLAVGPDDDVHVVWTGLNAFATSPQTDFYTGAPHDGFRQDAMYARR